MTQDEIIETNRRRRAMLVSAPLPVQRQPLTEKEIKDCLDAADQMYCERDGDKELFMVHAVLAAHNIKENT